MQKKVIVNQRDTRDCGACCLLSIIKYYDGFIPLEQIRLDTLTNNRGTSAYHMIEAMKRYGFDAYGTKITKEQFKNNIPLPAIVHVVLDNGSNHFMVLYEIRRESVVLMDPAKGRRILDYQDFFWIWSEVILFFSPKTKIIEWKKENHLKNIWHSFVKEQKKPYIAIFFLNIFILFFAICSSFYFKIGNDTIGTDENKYYFYFLIFLFLGLLLLRLVMEKEKNKLLQYWSKNINLKSIFSFLNHLFFLPYPIFKSRSTGEYVTRLWETIEMKFFFTDILFSILLNGIFFIISSILLYLLNKKLALFFLILSFFYAIIYLIVNKNFNQNLKNHNQVQMEFNNQIFEILNTYDTVKNLFIENTFLNSKEEKMIQYLKSNFKTEQNLKQNEEYKIILKEGLYFLLITSGLFLIEKQEINIIEFMTFQSVFSYFILFLESFLSSIPKWNYYQTILSKLGELYEIPEEPLKEITDTFLKGNIIIKNLEFSYNDFDVVFKGLNMEIAYNTHVVLKGDSGCGKSSLCKLLCRFYNDYEGEIIIGSENIKDVPISTIRNNILYLSQNEELITGTIKENIECKRTICSNAFHEVCSICQIEDIVKKRPLRYETTISPFENNLSGGEKQRIFLARALLSKKSIYLFDEPLSEVDDNLEKKIIKELRNFLKNKTVIYITHKNQKGLFDETIKFKKEYEKLHHE